MRIGVDFGTTHTSAAVAVGDQLLFVPLDKLNTVNPTILRSVIYIDRNHDYLLGRGAVEAFLEHDTGRPVLYEDKVVGTIENTVSQLSRDELEPDGPITIIYDVTIEEDTAIQGRLLQSIKTALRDKSYQGTSIFGKFYTIQELIALILSHVRVQAEQHFREDVTELVLGKPVRFSEDDETEALAVQHLREAAMLAGFQDVSFMPEPIAAALFYLRSVSEPHHLLVFDYGGGTLDLTVMHVQSPTDYQILATRGVLIGGDDLDSAIMQGNVARHFGTEASVDTFYNGKAVRFPPDLADYLYQWQTIPMLSRPKNLEIIERAISNGSDPIAFQALHTLVSHNYGFALFEEIEHAKRTLSEQTETTVALHKEALDVDIALTRPAFKESAYQSVSKIRHGVRRVVQEAGLAMEDIGVVVTTGGSSTIPFVRQLLTRELSSATIVHSSTFDSVTSGLAIAAAR